MASWDIDLLLSVRLRKANQYAVDESRGKFAVVCGKKNYSKESFIAEIIENKN